MAPVTDPGKNAGSVDEKQTPAALLSELRASQAAVAGDVATLVASLAPLGDAVEAIATALADAQKAKAEVSADKLSALNAIQVALETALTIIRAVSKYPVESDPFTETKRIGGNQPFPDD